MYTKQIRAPHMNRFWAENVIKKGMRNFEAKMKGQKGGGGGGRLMIKNTHTFLNKNALPVAPVNFCLGRMRNVIAISVFHLPHTIQ